MATLELKSAEVNLDTPEKREKFIKYANTKNTAANEKIRRMIRDNKSSFSKRK